MAFEEDPVMRRIAAELAEARMRAGMPFPRPELGEPSSAPAAPTSEPGIPEPVKKLLKIGVALGLIHELTD